MMYKTFYFENYSFDSVKSELCLRYSHDHQVYFEEKIVFPAMTRQLNDADIAAIDHACRLVFLLAGVSYYKTHVPPRLECPAFAVDAETARFVEKVYERGLGEFSFKNKLDLRGRINFISTDIPASAAPNPHLTRTLCVPVGGGKDSVVSIEALKKQTEPLSLFALTSTAGVADPIKDCIRVSGLPHITVERQLSPNLVALNKEPGVYNGHVPITAILSAIAVLACLLQGWDTLVLSNESSASAPNLHYNDQEINHQYSKSFEFEKDFSSYIKQHVAGNFRYFSLLRPLSEPAITKKFSQDTHYHSVFRSCNAAFRQEAGQRNKNWCCDCPKCRFVYLALAPFISKPRLINIFGKDMLGDATQISGFADLCGLGAHKPFECVGEVEESVLLIHKLSQMVDWKGSAVIKSLAGRLPVSTGFEKKFNHLFDIQGSHAVPSEYLKLIA